MMRKATKTIGENKREGKRKEITLGDCLPNWICSVHGSEYPVCVCTCYMPYSMLHLTYTAGIYAKRRVWIYSTPVSGTGPPLFFFLLLCGGVTLSVRGGSLYPHLLFKKKTGYAQYNRQAHRIFLIMLKPPNQPTLFLCILIFFSNLYFIRFSPR